MNDLILRRGSVNLGGDYIPAVLDGGVLELTARDGGGSTLISPAYWVAVVPHSAKPSPFDGDMLVGSD